jgi:hypothetical protein
MATYRFSLGSIECRIPRSAEPYADYLSIGLVATRNGEVIGQAKASPYGAGPHSRIELDFWAGKTRDLTPVFFGPGTDISWDVAFTLEPGDDPVDVSVVLCNLRDVGDPYLVSRVLVYVAAIATGLGISYEFGSYVREAAAWVLSDSDRRDALKKVIGLEYDDPLDVVLPDWLFDWNWPNCAGDVLLWRRRFTAEDVARGLGPIEIQPTDQYSVPIKQPERGCRNPQYIVHAFLVNDNILGPDAPTPTSRIFVPVTMKDAAMWEGDWCLMNSAGSCDFNVGFGVTRSYPVRGAEYAGNEKAFSADLRDIRETRSSWTHYVSDTVAHPTYSKAVETEVGGSTGSVAAGAVTGATAAGIGSGSYANAATGTDATKAFGKRVGGESSNGGVSAPAAPSALDKGAKDSDLVEPGERPDALAHDVRTLVLSDSVRLGLYRCVETFADGNTRETGPYVRYERAAGVAASRADYMLRADNRPA